MARGTGEKWKDLSSTERWAVFFILVFVVAQATAVVLAVEVDGPSVKGGFGPRLMSMLFNYESESVHIVSQPLLWVARLLLVAIVATVAVSIRAAKRRATERS
jgi:hypothetical protein